MKENISSNLFPESDILVLLNFVFLYGKQSCHICVIYLIDMLL